MAQYRTCIWCGAHLDPEEVCDCTMEDKNFSTESCDPSALHKHIVTIPEPTYGGTAMFYPSKKRRLNRIFSELAQFEITPFGAILDFLLDQGLTKEQFLNWYDKYHEYKNRKREIENEDSED